MLFFSWENFQGLIPTSCVVCARTLHSSPGICQHCQAQLPWISRHCFGCGLEFDEVELENNRCGSCLSYSAPLSSCHGLLHYRSPVNKLITDFKFQARFDIGKSLATLLAAAMVRHYREYEVPDLLLPVPLHYRRYWQRGFNQSWELCKIVSRATGIPCSRQVLRKRRHTLAQSDIGSARERANNLKAAFAIARHPCLETVKRVTIIDDVVTTMSTVSALATLLKGHGIQEVEAWCIARASIR